MKIASLIKMGDIISLPIPLTVSSSGSYGRTICFGFKENQNIEIRIDVDSFLAVADEPEPDKILDALDMTKEETMDRLSALICQVGGIPSLMEALAFLVELEVFDYARLVELTNDLGPFVTQPENAKP